MTFTLGATLKSASPKRGKPPGGRYISNPQTIRAATPPPRKPSFDTVLAATKGDRRAQQQVRLYAASQRAKQQGQAQARALQDNATFGGSEKTVYKSAKKTGLNPVGRAVISAVSPVEAAQQTYHAIRAGNPVGAGIAAAGFFPFGKFGRAAKAVEDVSAARRSAKAAARLAPQTKRQIETRVAELQRKVDRAVDTIAREYQANPDTHLPSTGLGKDTRPRRVQTEADKFKTHAIGTGTPIDEPLRPRGIGKTGIERARAKAEQEIYRLGRKEGAHPVMQRVADAMDELDHLKRMLNENADAAIFGHKPPGFHDLPAQERVLRSTGKAREARAQQKKLYSTERSIRAAKVEQAHQIGGLAGYHAARAQLKGELPKVQFDHLTDLTDHETDKIFSIIQQHPDLRPYEKVTLQGAILKAREGRVPATHEIKLIERAFGPEAAAQAKTLTLPQKAGRIAAEVINVPRSLLASFDVSAPFRQGLVAGSSHPAIFAKSFGPMFRALVSEKKYGSIMQEIADRPSFATMQDSGVKFTNLGVLSDREEQFMSNLAERIPVAGRGVRASGRAYTGFLNRMRADMFDHLVGVARAEGIETPKLRRDVARFVNVATGRGELGPLEPAAVALNTVLFSPRLFASRINVLNPVWYASLDPFARKQALKSMVRLIGAGMAVLGLAKLAGAKVNDDPRSADFGKIHVGNTRIDLWAGHQQIVRLVSQVSSGKIVSSTTGRTYRLTGGQSLSRQDITQRFFEGKLAPTPALVNDWFKGTDFAGKPFSWKQETVQRVIPLLAQDAHDLYNDTGSIPKAVGAYGLGAFGVGIQTYGPKKTKPLTSKQKRSTPALRGGVDTGATLDSGFSSSVSPSGGFQLGGTLRR